tara:strand:+ start:387 stop:1403 length:1017 start_codon:yes stop_codon:yes gene_type:complete
MDDLKAQIKKARDIKDSSIKTYMGALRKIHEKLEGKETDYKNAKFLNDYDKVMKVIDTEGKLTSKKNKLTAVLVALSSQDKKNDELIKKYNDTLKTMNEQYFAFLRQQKKTTTQRKNWISYGEVIKIVNKIMNHIKIFQHYETLNKSEFDILQQYVMLRTYLTFPLRNDYADMPVITLKKFKKLSNDEQESKNYLILSDKRKQFNINQFKNKKFIGSKVLKIPQKLSRVIDLWLMHNKSGFYFVKQDRISPMNPNNITKFLNKIFKKYANGKKISTSMLRHIVISHMLKGTKTLSEQDKEAKDIENKFFHSKAVNDLYRKVDDDDDDDDNDEIDDIVE